MKIGGSFKGDFLEKINKRLEQWEGQPKIAAAITVPPELQWWYYQEFGVAGHPIAPVQSKQLVLPGPVFIPEGQSVEWPGIEPTHTVGTVYEKLQEKAVEQLPALFGDNGYNPEEVKKQFLTQFMEEVKQEIVDQMATDIPGTREANADYPKQGGKLGGRHASDVFDELATIEDTSE